MGQARTPESRGGSRFVHEQLSVGDVISARRPQSHFQLAEASNYLLTAGGIDITPIITMVAPVDRLGANWRLVYEGGSGAACHSLRS